MTIAFIGNPSVGKSVFFSRLTGVGVEISNYPGTTVALKRGTVKARGKTIEVVDLPGIYSLGVTNEDEKVTKKYLVQDKPDIIVNVLDASRLERNLFLTLQLMELDIPMVIALNQVDLAADLGILVDVDRLSELLGLPVVPTVAIWGIGLDEVALVAEFFKDLDNPAKFPSEGEIDHIEEPMIAAVIHTPPEFVGGLLKLCQERRGTQTSLSYAGEKRVIIRYDLPLTEVVFGFYDRMKSVSRGYASLDYEPKGYQPADLVRLDLLVNGDRVDSLSAVIHRETSYIKGRDLCIKMKELIPMQQFEVAIQAALGSRVIAKTVVKALRKNVTAKCYGGDITRKRKLLEKQKEGKKRMKQVGNVEIPQEAFLAILKVE